MAEIHDLSQERIQRQIDAIMERAKNRKGMLRELNLSAFKQLTFRTVLSSWQVNSALNPGNEPPGPDVLSIVIFDASKEFVQAVGILRITDEQWRELAEACAQILLGQEEIKRRLEEK